MPERIQKLRILVGTVSGTAERVALAIEMDCVDLVDHIQVQTMDGLDIGVFDADALFLICTSTFGAGDVPDNARQLFDSLDLTPRYLGPMCYGVLALGDSASHGDTFCFAGKLFDERLTDLGARRVGDIGLLDASADELPEAVGVTWCRDWIKVAARTWG